MRLESFFDEAVVVFWAFQYLHDFAPNLIAGDIINAKVNDTALFTCAWTASVKSSASWSVNDITAFYHLFKFFSSDWVFLNYLVISRDGGRPSHDAPQYLPRDVNSTRKLNVIITKHQYPLWVIYFFLRNLVNLKYKLVWNSWWFTKTWIDNPGCGW